MKFTKMNGAGNDFVVLDNRDARYNELLTKENIALLCNRQRGIGADGLLAVESHEGTHPYHMRYHNADGGLADMCGNGARCFGKFLCDHLNLGTQSGIGFHTDAGELYAKKIGDEIEIAMTEPHDHRPNLTVELDSQSHKVDHWNTGVPHVVEQLGSLDELQRLDIAQRGKFLREHTLFAPQGANANFYAIRAQGHISVRTYERGVESETLACGTGVVASALVYGAQYQADRQVLVDVAGQETLRVRWSLDERAQITEVFLKGPAVATFEGIFDRSLLSRARQSES